MTSKRIPILLLMLCLPALSADAQTVVYASDFTDGATTGWSTTITEPFFQGIMGTTSPPNGGRFLGEFGRQTIRLDLVSLPAHDSIRIVFDLYAIQTWDGNNTNASGPDIWSVGIAGAPPLVRTTFNNNGFATQAYPDSFPGGVNRHQTGAASTNTLGYTNFGDAIYHFDLRLPHTAAAMTLELIGELREEANTARLTNESWGVDNVEITAIRAPVVRPAATLAAGNIEGAPGEIVDLPIRLRNARALEESGATSFEGTLRFDASLLLPLDVEMLGTVSGGDRLVPLTLPVATGPDSILTTIRFRVGLGGSLSTALRLEDFVSTGGNVEIDTIAGRFLLDDICNSGDRARLVVSGPEAAIKPSPNPASAVMALDYSLVGDGPLLLELYDTDGTLLSTLIDAPARHGSYRYLLDLAAYPSGRYLVVLRSGREVVEAELRVVR